MSAIGKYVRAPTVLSDSDTEGSLHDEEVSGKYVRSANAQQTGGDGELIHEVSDEYNHYRSAIVSDCQKQLEARIQELEHVIKEMGGTSRNSAVDKATTNRTTNVSTRRVSPVNRNEGIIRLDNIKPFPKNVSATKMWEAWMSFIEDFEMAASLERQ